jgi:hypothetical protein
LSFTRLLSFAIQKQEQMDALKERAGTLIKKGA